MNLTELAKQCYEASVKNGFYDGTKELYSVDSFISPKKEEERLNAVSTKLMLIVSEVAEAVEELREGNQGEALYNVVYKQVPDVDLPKPEGFASELADVIIRVMDLCGALGIDIQDVVESKIAFNALRSKRHGKAF